MDLAIETQEKNRILREEARLDPGSINEPFTVSGGKLAEPQELSLERYYAVRPNPPPCVINLVNFAN